MMETLMGLCLVSIFIITVMLVALIVTLCEIYELEKDCTKLEGHNEELRRMLNEIRDETRDS